MTSGGALTERNRLMVAGSGVAAFALVHLSLAGMRPWEVAEGAAVAYAPHAQLLLQPFGAMPYGAAVAVWSVLNLFCIFRAAELICPRRDLALLACVAPAALTMVATGYAGGFLALLATVVLVQGRKRPALAGLNLALMTIEPQFALLLALILLPLGYRRAVMFAALWTLALLSASVITFGVEPWLRYLYAPTPASPGAAVSLFSAARIIGLPESIAHAVQWTFGFAGLAGSASVFLRRGPDPRSIALLLLAVTVSLPGSGSATLAIAAPALTLALFAESPGDDPTLLPFGAALALWLAPPLAELLAWPIVPFALAALLLYALARAQTTTDVPLAAERVRR